MEVWQNGSVAEWKYGRMEVWQNGSMEVWKYGRIEVWQNGSMKVWKYESMVERQNITPQSQLQFLLSSSVASFYTNMLYCHITCWYCLGTDDGAEFFVFEKRAAVSRGLCM